MTRRPLSLLAGLTTGGLMFLTACGSSSPPISASASSQLAQQVQAIRSAAEAGNAPGALSQIALLKSEVANLQSSHQITSQRGAQILSAASAVTAELSLLTTTTTTTTTNDQPVAPAPPPGPSKKSGDQGGKGSDH